MQTLALFLAYLYFALADPCTVLKIGKAVYNANIVENFCVYNNVRFATPPVGDLRFAGPEPPTDNDPAPPAGPVSCVAMNSTQPCLNLIGPARCDLSPYNVGVEQEDCLFLDIYVPANSTSQSMPVVVWIYGGGFVFGSKQSFDFTKIPLYDGVGPLSRAPVPTIFVAINYRLGAYGWLAGTYMENTGSSTPNAGLADQRAAISFVSANIAQLGGNASNLAVWGESAGASSILHHLVSTEDVPFQRAILMSPAYQWQWDRNGVLNDTYTQFAQSVGCNDGDIECVRGKDFQTLKDANQQLWQEVICEGIFPVGPAVDGKVITTLPPLSLKNGPIKKLDSLIVSHVGQEVLWNSPFVPLPIRQNPTDPTKVTDFLNEFLNGSEYVGLRSQIEGQYPSNAFANQSARAAQVIKDSSFVCNTRQLIDAYSGSSSVYAMEYDFLEKYNFAVHGTDLLPLFSDNTDYNVVIKQCTGQDSFLVKSVVFFLNNVTSPTMQKFFMTHAATGNPNRQGSTQWAEVSTGTCTTPSQGTCVQDVMQVHFVNPAPFSYGSEDSQTSSETCDFWYNIVEQIVQIGKRQAESVDQDPSLVQLEL